MRHALRLALALPAVLACAHRPGPSAGELEELRRAIAQCPLPLTDAALDDLSTYERCRLPATVTRLVRNDYLEDDALPPDRAALARHARALPRASFEAQLRRFVDPTRALDGWIEIDPAREVLRPDPILAPEVEIPFAPAPHPDPLPAPRGEGAGRHAPPVAHVSPSHPARRAGGEGRGGGAVLVPPARPDLPYRAARRAELLRQVTPALPLAGVRVGLDPGHSGGPFAALEERRTTLPRAEVGRPLLLQEGDLTLRTALELRAKLAALGAEVVLTRDRPALVHAHQLHELRPAADRLLSRIALDPAHAALEAALTPGERARLRSGLAVLAVRARSRLASLQARARLLADASPDVAISIHYNAAPPGAPPHLAQDLVVMVRGFHDRSRLYRSRDRWRALDQGFAVDDFNASVHLGAGCVRAMADRLGIATARDGRYPDQLPLLDANGGRLGVSAWNGLLLRSLDGVAVLAEGPYMTVREEAERLEAGLAAPFGTAGTRLERYADALASCVRGFVARWLGSERNPFGTDP